MRVKCVEELQVYQHALAATTEISAILRRDTFRGDLRLREQMGSASERVASLIAEGFSQKTDRHFASYCYQARGSSAEVRTQLRVALGRGHLVDHELACLTERYNEIERMLTGLIKHLNREDRKCRG